MSSPNKSIQLNFFDINGEYKEDVEVDTQKIFLNIDSPIRIIEKFVNENSVQDLKKNKEDNFITQYYFCYEIEKKQFVKINCDIINNFSVSHQCTLNSNGYIVFCNLESKNTFDLLGKILYYINESCSVNVKTYIIGVFKENIDEDKTYFKMREFLDKCEIELEYCEMYIGDMDKYGIISKEHENAEDLKEIFNRIFKEIYEGGRHIISKNIKDLNERHDNSMGYCEIF